MGLFSEFKDVIEDAKKAFGRLEKKIDRMLKLLEEIRDLLKESERCSGG
jgi:large-conductance mechanosensitive channel